MSWFSCSDPCSICFSPNKPNYAQVFTMWLMVQFHNQIFLILSFLFFIYFSCLKNFSCSNLHNVTQIHHQVTRVTFLHMSIILTIQIKFLSSIAKRTVIFFYIFLQDVEFVVTFYAWILVFLKPIMFSSSEIASWLN